MQIARFGDGEQQVVGPVSDRVLPTPGRQVDEGPQVGGAGEVERLTGRTPCRATYASSTASTNAGCRSKRSRLPRSV